ncbi:MAG: hypothetical protein ACOYVF_02230 [Candidatus Zixiibacteriota bacterium]
MKKDNLEKTEIVELLKSLDEKSMTLIDLDSVRNCLREMLEQTCQQETLADSAAILRDDYTARIAGMLKALAAADRKRDSWTQVLELVERLPAMTASELVACYHRVSARFRDNFPTSFNWPTANRSDRGLRNIHQFK